MRALTYKKYGAPEKVLELKEVPKPVPGENQVLVKIRAAAVNDYDWGMTRGLPRLYRLLFGLFKPKHNIPGMELAGTVEAPGPGALKFKKGDAVYGDISEFGFGAFAEYVCVNEEALVLKPERMSFEEAAAVSHASMLALQGLRDLGNIQTGSKLLVNGAGGGVGTFALQIARLHDAEVTGVDTGDKLKMMKDLGFDRVVDYKQEDFTKSGVRYDLILDAKTSRSPFAYARALKPGGTYVTVGGYLPRLLQAFLLGPLVSLFAKKSIRILGLKANQGLDHINELYTAGKIKCIVDGPHALEDVPALIQYFGEGKHTGKVVVRVQAGGDVHRPNPA